MCCVVLCVALFFLGGGGVVSDLAPAFFGGGRLGFRLYKQGPGFRVRGGEGGGLGFRV